MNEEEINILNKTEKEVLVNRMVIMSILEYLKVSEENQVRIFEIAIERLENKIKENEESEKK